MPVPVTSFVSTRMVSITSMGHSPRKPQGHGGHFCPNIRLHWVSTVSDNSIKQASCYPTSRSAHLPASLNTVLKAPQREAHPNTQQTRLCPRASLTSQTLSVTQTIQKNQPLPHVPRILMTWTEDLPTEHP